MSHTFSFLIKFPIDMDMATINYIYTYILHCITLLTCVTKIDYKIMTSIHTKLDEIFSFLENVKVKKNASF